MRGVHQNVCEARGRTAMDEPWHAAPLPLKQLFCMLSVYLGAYVTWVSATEGSMQRFSCVLVSSFMQRRILVPADMLTTGEMLMHGEEVLRKMRLVNSSYFSKHA
eukprot:6210809-Pleurochrysis_carterae.AAC.5